MWSIPKDKSFARTDAQCDECGGNGCELCDDKGWVPQDSRHARKCPACQRALQPTQIAVYCSTECAASDA